MPFKISNRRYTGSKAKLAEWIIKLIEQNCQGESLCDIFAGTGIISEKSSALNLNKIVVNDILYSNNTIYKAFFETGKYSNKLLESYRVNFSQLKAQMLKENYFSKNFGGKFFSVDDAKKIGYIREQLKKDKKDLTQKEYNILLASLLYSTDKVANTVGHYDAYIHSNNINSCFVFDLIEPLLTDVKYDIYREDANKLAKKIQSDIVYIDPPYNSRQYSRFYHVLENITKWTKPELFGVALKPEPENMSEYCRVSASAVFADLIESLKCKYIVVSYNNTYASKSNSSKNKISLEFIEETLKLKGKLQIFEKSHQFFNAGKTEFRDHKEFIFIVEVGGKNG